MITRNKLSHQPENKLTNKFQPIDFEEEDFIDTGKNKRKLRHSVKNPNKKRSRTKLMMILLPILLLVVAGITFGIIWLVSPKKEDVVVDETLDNNAETIDDAMDTEDANIPEETVDEAAMSILPITEAVSTNPTIQYGRLMLINPNFTVENSFIAARKNELISVEGTYGIVEGNRSTNGDNLLDKEAAVALSKMNADYTIANPGHVLQTRSCFREVGTSCGRMCATTGTSDHHTGLTCDLIDPIYGNSLDTAAYDAHIEWQWLKENSYKYGFIDRFPEAWAGGPMSEPANVDENGTTGLFETWHYRYVGVFAATEIATGIYNNGEYDSLEHYLKMRGLVPNLLNN